MNRSGDNPFKGIPDVELISRYRETGNQDLVAEFFRRYSGLILGTCYKFLKNEGDSKDASMDIFLELVDKLKLHEVSHPKSWLYILVKNHCLMKLRKLANFETIPLDLEKLGLVLVESETFGHLTEESSEDQGFFEEAVSMLNEYQKVCIELFYLNEKSYKEIVAITGFDLSSVKSHIQNGKRNLGIIFKKNKQTHSK